MFTAFLNRFLFDRVVQCRVNGDQKTSGKCYTLSIIECRQLIVIHIVNVIRWEGRHGQIKLPDPLFFTLTLETLTDDVAAREWDRMETIHKSKPLTDTRKPTL